MGCLYWGKCEMFWQNTLRIVFVLIVITIVIIYKRHICANISNILSICAVFEALFSTSFPWESTFSSSSFSETLPLQRQQNMGSHSLYCVVWQQHHWEITFHNLCKFARVCLSVQWDSQMGFLCSQFQAWMIELPFASTGQGICQWLVNL